jgi:hypothetical protein
MMTLDRKNLQAAHVAEVAGTDVTTVQTWTSRGMTTQYGLAVRLKRGRGHARMYSLRDALKFALMVRLHQNYRMPLPQGRKICGVVFGDSFEPESARYSIVTATPMNAQAKWYPDELAVAKALSTSRVATVINVGLIFREVCHSLEKLLPPEELPHANK